MPIPGKPPRQVVIDRQRKLFASINIEDLLLELVRTRNILNYIHNMRILGLLAHFSSFLF